jgi:hypothetical protein
MAHGIDSSKTAARPSHEAIELEVTATKVGESDQRRIDQAAMEAAKRSTNRIHADEESTPGDTVFSK